jgi:protein transport protein SEC23
MKYLAEKTGGIVVMNESFNSDVFRNTYKKLFDRDVNGFLKLGYAARLDVLVSRDLRVQGAIGPCISLKKAGPMVSENPIGESGTTSWYLGGIDRNSTLALLYDLNVKEAAASKFAFFQFLTTYRHSSGRQHLRVTTVCRRFADPNNIMDLTSGFDQEAATVLMARQGVLKTEQEEYIEVLKWLDRSLIRLVARFAEYRKDDSTSFRLAKEF